MKIADLLEKSDFECETTREFLRTAPGAAHCADFKLRTLRGSDIKALRHVAGARISSSYRKCSTPDAERRVAEAMSNFNPERIIIARNSVVVDGKYHVIAAARAGLHVNVLDLAHPQPQSEDPEYG